jgi:hypothetical protein
MANTSSTAVEYSSHNPKTLGSNPLVAANQPATLLKVAGNETQVGKLHWAIITAKKFYQTDPRFKSLVKYPTFNEGWTNLNFVKN